jgi:predicted transposase/invertase (TIGR01784 family)
VEIQQTREHDYLQRMIYGVAKTITEHMSSGQRYENVKKVFSINILYFNLGEGEDYLYHGQTRLQGVHTNDSLKLTDYERDDLHVLSPEQVFPEYFVIRVNVFDKPTVNGWLEEWMDYLKNERINPDTTAPGLQEARKRLDLLRMTDVERRRYEHDIDTLVRDTDVMRTQLLEAEIKGRKKGLAEGREKGLAEGREKGLAEGRAEGAGEAKRENARRMKADKMPLELIAKYTGLTADEIVTL